jgi:hypothetical protein
LANYPPDPQGQKRGIEMEAKVREHEDWIETEFGAADLGAARRTQRLLTLMGQVVARPGASLSEAGRVLELLSAGFSLECQTHSDSQRGR